MSLCYVLYVFVTHIIKIPCYCYCVKASETITVPVADTIHGRDGPFCDRPTGVCLYTDLDFWLF